MQLLMYAYMYKCENKVEASSSIISFITGKGEPFELSARSMSMEELIDLFPKCLELLFEEIYNSEIDFNHEGGYISYCKYC